MESLYFMTSQTYLTFSANLTPKDILQFLEFRMLSPVQFWELVIFKFWRMVVLLKSSNSCFAFSRVSKEERSYSVIFFWYSSLVNCSFLKQYCLLRKLVHIKQSRQFLQFQRKLELEQFSEKYKKRPWLQVIHSTQSYKNSDSFTTCMQSTQSLEWLPRYTYSILV